MGVRNGLPTDQASRWLTSGGTRLGGCASQVLPRAPSATPSKPAQGFVKCPHGNSLRLQVVFDEGAFASPDPISVYIPLPLTDFRLPPDSGDQGRLQR